MQPNKRNMTKIKRCSDVLSKIDFANQSMKMCKDFVTKHYRKSSCSGTTLTYAKSNQAIKT